MNFYRNCKKLIIHVWILFNVKISENIKNGFGINDRNKSNLISNTDGLKSPGTVIPLVSTTFYNSSSLQFQPTPQHLPQDFQSQSSSATAYTGSVILPNKIVSSNTNSRPPPSAFSHQANNRMSNSHSTTQMQLHQSNGMISIMSNYPPRVNYSRISTGSSSSGAVASIRTNPEYYLPISPPRPPSSSRLTSSSSITKMNEYVRGPHGIYTRDNVLQESQPKGIHILFYKISL